MPEAVVVATREVDQLMRKFFAQPNAQKNAFRTPQEGETVLSHPAYLTPSPGWCELFEVRRSECDPAYRFPPGCKRACLRLFDLLRELSLSWLAVLSHHLCGDERWLPSLATKDTGPATLRVLHYDQVVDLGREVGTLPLGTPARRDAERRMMAGWPSHVDSSLVTLAPRASASGLAVRDYATDKWLRVERQMSAREAVLFCGDPVAFASCHVFPAAMHRPDALEMARQAPATRISTPCFLYADDGGILDASRTHAKLLEAAGQSRQCLVRPSPEQLSVREFKLNLRNCRELWPWKREEYYSGRVICRDSDHFPGLKEEENNTMVYDDDHLT